MECRWLTAQECGLPAPPATMTRRPVKVIGTTVHHTATPDPEQHPVQRWAEIAHEATSGGLADHYVYTPYNAGVCKLAPGVGGILLGRPNDVVGAHARSMRGPNVVDAEAGIANLYTIGVALIGTDPTPEATWALQVYCFCAALAGAPLIFDHSDWARWIGVPTACPGDVMRADVVRLRQGRAF